MNGQTLEKWDAKPWRESRYWGRLILQTPVDLWLFTELIEKTNPSVIVEVGMLEGGFFEWLYDATSHIECLENRRAIIFGIDIETPSGIVKRRRVRVREVDSIFATKELHAVGLRSAIDLSRKRLDNRPVIFILDDDHAPAHVYKELESYSAICKPGDWIVVCDTVPVQGLAWTVSSWLETAEGREFVAEPVDRFGLSNHRGGWLRKVK